MNNPDPTNNDAMKELHEWFPKWTKFWGLSSLQGIEYLSLYVAGRLNIEQSMEKIRKWELSDEQIKELGS